MSFTERDKYMPTYKNNPTSQYIVRTSVRTHRPYVSSNFSSQLTPKEKLARQQQRFSSAGMGTLGGFGVGSGFGGGSGVGAGGTVLSSQGNFFSPQLSTDFLELPQSIRERREIYRHFYNSDELVGQALDIHTELPLSKVRLAAPKPRLAPKGFESPENYGKYILSRFERMCKHIKLFQKLIMMVHHFYLDGCAPAFAEDSVVEVPLDVGHKKQRVKQAVLHDDGTTSEVEEDAWVEDDSTEAAEMEYYRKHYKGWDKLIVLPIDRLKITTFDYTSKSIIELIPSDRDRALMDKARTGDPVAEKLVMEIPDEVREHLEKGEPIPLGTDPDEGSFVYLLTGSKEADNPLGQSILNRTLRSLYFKEKLRQAQTSIASRAMTPKRIVWAEGLSDVDTDLLREQVDLALVDPDYSIVTNYELHWEEMGSRDRLLDLQSEYEQIDKRLLAGLGVTESLMSGESLYSGDRLKLEVINQRYLHLREILQEYVEENLFRPVAVRMGFVETDEWGQEVVLYPRLSFTRMPLRDSQDTFDALYSLYQKGSISIDFILEMFNIDPDDTRVKLERDMFTVNDALFNEILRSLYNEVGRVLGEKSDIVEKIASYMKLKIKEEAPQEEGRY
jgi:hypothetical protein